MNKTRGLKVEYTEETKRISGILPSSHSLSLLGASNHLRLSPAGAMRFSHLRSDSEPPDLKDKGTIFLVNKPFSSKFFPYIATKESDRMADSSQYLEFPNLHVKL